MRIIAVVWIEQAPYAVGVRKILPCSEAERFCGTRCSGLALRWRVM